MYRLYAIIIFVYAMLAVLILSVTNWRALVWLDIALFIGIYCIVPGIAGCLLWRKHVLGLVSTAVFFACHVVRSIGGEPKNLSNPPISLGIPFGDFSGGNGYLFDFFALALMTASLLLLGRHFIQRRPSDSKYNDQ